MNLRLNSKITKVILPSHIDTIMLFGFILSKKEKLAKKEIKHQLGHALQYYDCVLLGTCFTTIVVLILFGFQIVSPFILWLLLLPFMLFYIFYWVEFLIRLVKYRNIKKAYENISFEKHAIAFANSRAKYESFQWSKYL